MSRFRMTAIALTTVVFLFSSMATALAVHEDVIVEKIPTSDVQVALETVADGFTSPVWAINAPGDNHRIFVVDQVGKITAIKLDPGENDNVPDRLAFLDVGVDGLGLLVPLGAFGPGSFDERGLLGLAFHPDYRKNGLIYTYTSEPASGAADFSTIPDGVDPNHQGALREWHVPNPKRADSVVDTNSSRVLLTIDEPQFNHNGGALNFGPDGMLYLAVGDGGAADDQGAGHAVGGNGQDLSDGNVLGKILRIDAMGSNSANGEYGIPADNPFVGSQGADEIYAYGFRNPFRFSFDTDTGELIAADVGQNDIEEIDMVVSGGNYGWPVKEGTFLFDMNGADAGFTTGSSPGAPPGLIDPVAEYDHDEGISVTGGFTYRGKRVKDLRDSYVFGEWTGRLLHLTKDGPIAELNPVGQDGVGVNITGFGQDRKGELYVLGQPGFTPVGTDGVIMRIVAAKHVREFEAELAGDNEVPPVDSDAGGEASFKANPARTEVRYKLEVEDIESAVQAHIHIGAPGTNGPVVAFLFGPVPGGIDVDEEQTIAQGTLTAGNLVGPLAGMTINDLLVEMQRGNAYVNVHTVANPGGEIRGQIEAD
ncbi:MAG: PQQ-dependent sugar dehydrogenase [Acidimicrobiia bacterium]|nr:PQQ-dependent sugar dehydrogenase [Acidimicrobiia bacterium]